MGIEDSVKTAQEEFMAKVMILIQDKYGISRLTLAELDGKCKQENLVYPEWGGMDLPDTLRRLARKGFVDFDGDEVSIKPSLRNMTSIRLERLSEPFGGE